MESNRGPRSTPKYIHGHVEDGKVIPTEFVQGILAGSKKMVIRRDSRLSFTMAASHGKLYLRDRHNGIVTLQNGEFAIPGLNGVLMQVNLPTNRLAFLVKNGKNGGGASYMVENFHSMEKYRFERRVEEVLAQASTSRTQAHIALLVAATLAGIAGFAGSRGCFTSDSEATALAPAEEGE